VRGDDSQGGPEGRSGGGRSRNRRRRPSPVQTKAGNIEAVELDADVLEQRRGQYKDGKALGRYQMLVHVSADATHIAVLEGRSLVEHYVARPSDDVFQIHGNIYVGRVENVLPGMEAAFVDIATPKNAVLYRSDVTFDPDDVEGVQPGEQPRIEQVLKDRQLVVCQVTKNPIAHKGARLTQEVSIPGRFVVFVPNSQTVGISKRLPDDERKRLRRILERARPEGHGLIVRTAAQGVTAEEIDRDVRHLSAQWAEIDKMAQAQRSPRLLYREPPMAVRMIREEFNSDFRAVMIDDQELYEEIHGYASAVAPALADRVTFYDPGDQLPLFERHHVSEQLAKVLDRKVWLPSGGSLIIEATEALTVIDVNTGKNVGSSSLEETVFANNMEAATEIARQLRLRDIGGIIVLDFVDMEIKENRDKVVRQLKDALRRDKTRTQVFPISELGLVEMTRKRIGEGLLESVSHRCETCDGRGVIVPEDLLD
jgi:ribonuclease E